MRGANEGRGGGFDIVPWLPQKRGDTGLVDAVSKAPCRAELAEATEASESRTRPLEPVPGGQEDQTMALVVSWPMDSFAPFIDRARNNTSSQPPRCHAL